MVSIAEVLQNTRPWHVEVCDVRAGLDLLPAGCVHSVVTSPPYFALRSYLPKGHPDKHLEIGSEPTVEAFVATMVGVFRGVRRVLRDDGVVFLNLGDSFSAGGWECRRVSNVKQQGSMDPDERRTGQDNGVQSGCKIGIPWRVAFALVEDGWVLRQDIIWAKAFSGEFGRGAVMPESVNGTRWERCRVKVAKAGTIEGRKNCQLENAAVAGLARFTGGVDTAPTEWLPCPGCDKCRDNDGLVLRRGSGRPITAHEYVFVLTKGTGYFYDNEAVREKSAGVGGGSSFGNQSHDTNGTGAQSRQYERPDYSTRNPRSVMFWPTQAFPDAHFATFPECIPAWCFRASTSAKGVCPECGAQWARVVDRDEPQRDWRETDTPRTMRNGFRPTCTCNRTDVVPPLVLDPFGGAMTTAYVANKMGLRSISFELNPEYAEIGRRRMRPGGKSQGVKPDPGQQSLFPQEAGS